MKILMVSEDVPYKGMGGLGRHAVTLANALIRDGHTVDFLGNDLFSYEQYKDETNFHGNFISKLSLRYTSWREQKLGFYNYYRLDFMARRFARTIMQYADAYDVIHYHGHIPIVANYIPEGVNFVQTRHDHGSVCMLQTRFKNHAVCNDVMPSACATCINPKPNYAQRTLSRMSVSRFREEAARALERHKTIFVSKCLKDNFEKTVRNLDKNKNYIVHNFLDYSRTREILSKIKQENSDAIEILIVTTLYEAKGAGAFLEEICRHGRSGLQVSIIGDGGQHAVFLRHRYSDHGVSFLGWQNYGEVIRRVANCDAVVVPSIWEEPCATTVLEALALGKLTYALRRGGTPELSVYQRYDGQLKLFDAMPELVEGLKSIKNKAMRRDYDTFEGDVQNALGKIVTIYKE